MGSITLTKMTGSENYLVIMQRNGERESEESDNVFSVSIDFGVSMGVQYLFTVIHFLSSLFFISFFRHWKPL